MRELSQQEHDDSNGDDQLIEGETATVTITPFGPRANREYEVEAGVSLGTVKQDAREQAVADGLDVFHVSKVNGRIVDRTNGGFDDYRPEQGGQGGESA